jgi:hypothetical protein
MVRIVTAALEHQPEHFHATRQRVGTFASQMIG